MIPLSKYYYIALKAIGNVLAYIFLKLNFEFIINDDNVACNN